MGYQYCYLLSSKTVFPGCGAPDGCNIASISAITEIELLCWKTATERDLKVVKDFIEDSIVFELEAAIKNKTVEIRRHQKIKLPDAVIAATALDHNLTLITRNTDDFKSVPGLNVFNPWSL